MNDPRSQSHPQGLPKVSSIPTAPKPMKEPELDPIALVEDAAPPPPAPGQVAQPQVSKIRAFSVAGHQHNYQFKRQTSVTGSGACRVRSFHGRLSDEGLIYLDEKINEWLDQHPEIEVKNVTTSIGLYDGKIKENALILNVWY
jgi:hypothetical protein